AVPTHPTLAVRVAGQRVWGRFPFHEAVFIGGAGTVRGYSEHRFAGDAGLYGNVELRFRLGRPSLVVPGDFGVFGLADAGRVYVSGETSDRWHAAAGGGLWFAPLSASNTVSVAVPRSPGRTAVYLRLGFGRQTKSLRLRGADGHVYVFRSVDKDPAGAMPPELRATFVERLLQDQISASHPVGALVVGPLLRAAGVYHAEPQLVAMPDDPRLDSFPEFKGMLGQLEEHPTVDPDEDVGFEGAEKIASTQKLWEHLTRDSHHRVDSRAFLAARLLDVFVGDWDRHPDQWRWARFDEAGVHVWRPIPRDRDQAFSRLDGVLPGLARYYYPDL